MKPLRASAIGLCALLALATRCAASRARHEAAPASEPSAPLASANNVGVSNASAPANTKPTGAILKGAGAVRDDIILLSFEDGTAKLPSFGNGADGKVDFALLDLAAASRPSSLTITSAGDPNYRSGAAPRAVHRKSRAVDVTNHGGHYEWVTQHDLILQLAHPLRQGVTYEIDASQLSRGSGKVSLRFDDHSTRSVAVHANQVGYAPLAPSKYAYVSAWLGDLGALSFDEYAGGEFHVIDTATGQVLVSGKPELRKRLAGNEPDSAAGENFTQADVWQLDFSALNRPGTYRVCLDRVGCSHPFVVEADVYRPLYLATGNALYLQRCGVGLDPKLTPWHRPRCHHPEIRPIYQSTHRSTDDGWSDDRTKEALASATSETRDAWGGYHDAGDWDREVWHPRLAHDLLLAYELAPSHFRDGDFDIPENGNGIPDIIDSAIWTIDYWRRLQRPTGAVSLGFFHSSYPKQGETSWTDSNGWYTFAEDPAHSLRYAAAAAHLAELLNGLGKHALAEPYLESAKAAYSWALGNTAAADDDHSQKWGGKTRDARVLAAAALFKATGGAEFDAAFQRELRIDGPQTPLVEWDHHNQDMAVYLYVTTKRVNLNATLRARLVAAILASAQRDLIDTAEKRAYRLGYDWGKPTAWGALSHAQVQPLMVAHALTGDPEYLRYYHTTLDHQLGGNPLDMVWVVGFGAKSPRRMYHPDSWYIGSGTPPAGFIPMGPHHFLPGAADGPWEPRFGMQTAYPAASQWPVEELWFENRFAPVTSEFVTNDIAYATAVFGYVSGR